ncbi:sensor histidine kinase [Paenibacillus wulumuqiensis]|uniref:sensor histidine kinase n=1 Tax=Paenibacillus wulumuqiensis TaxID=1567107 RepID=UPI002286C611|nr:PAS domain S-box protein [Paenibacillus wulumuqiensis]
MLYKSYRNLSLQPQNSLSSSQDNYYTSLFQYHDDPIIQLDRSGYVVNVNPAADRLGLPAGFRYVACKFTDIMFHNREQEAWDALHQVLQGKTSVLQLSTEQDNGELLHWKVTFLPLYEHEEVRGALLMAADHTDNYRLTQELTSRDSIFSLIEKTVIDTVFVVDWEGIPSYVSPSFEKILGYPMGSYLYNHSVFLYFTEEEKVKMNIEFEKLQRGQSISGYQFTFPHADGSTIYLESNATPVLENDGTVQKIIFVMRNITARKKAEEAVRQNKEVYIQLQSSLDRFSERAAGLMKTSELEHCLLQEIRLILGVEQVALLETGNFMYFSCKSGQCPKDDILSALREYQGIRLPEGYPFYRADGIFFSIGERRGLTNLVWIGEVTDRLNQEPVRIWLKTMVRYMSVFYESLLKIKDLTSELARLTEEQNTPAWLLRLLYSVSENERKNLAQDLHDAALQEQIIWYRRLENLQYSSEIPENIKEGLRQISDGLLDVIHQIRMTCNELRPPFLKEWGINQALESLYEQVQLRSDYRIIFDHSRFQNPLVDDQLIAIYRINQELLNNACKHSQASEVHITIADHDDGILMTYEDNGIGLSWEELQHSYKSMGLYGIKERVRSLEGDIEVFSDCGQGLTIHIHLPYIQSTASGTFKHLYG